MHWITALRQRRKPIRVVITGLGRIGKGILYQTRITPGFQCVGVADLDLPKAVRCLSELKVPHRVVHSASAAQEAARRGLVAVSADGDVVAGMDGVDALIESTGAIGDGARFALLALEHGQHLVLMNAEADLIFGPYLLDQARQAGVVYTSCDGDQHGVIKRLIDDMQAWGFQPVMGGNIKGFLDRYSNPAKIALEADKRGLDHRMCAAFTDGTKVNIEMALLANALGMRTDVPGMHGPAARDVDEVLRLFDFASLRRDGRPVVDYVLGACPGGGVFAVGYCDHPYQQSMMQYYKMGDGPFYLFYRPYHLCHVESLQCVAEAVLDGQSLLSPEAGFCTNVFAYAKRDLKAGETLDGVGGYTCYGLIENCPSQQPPAGLPICLAHDVVLQRDKGRDEPVLFEDVQYDATRFDIALYTRALRVQLVTRAPVMARAA
jgi:predicted homoserine dehydrogenase-like protein